MRFEPGFVRSLRDDITRVRPETQEYVNDPHGLPAQRLIELVWHPSSSTITEAEDLEGQEVMHGGGSNMSHHVIGREELANGDTALCLLVGDLTEVPDLIRAARDAAVKHVWAFAHRGTVGLDVMRCLLGFGDEITFVNGFESYALGPDNCLARDPMGEPLLYGLGTADSLCALRKQGILRKFTALGGKHVAFVRPDTPFDTLLGLVGQHLLTRSELTCEVRPRHRGDPRPLIAWHEGQLKAFEPCRLDGPDPDDFSWSATGTCVVQASAEARCGHEFTFHRQRVNRGRMLTVEHRRSLLELTERLSTHYVTFEDNA